MAITLGELLALPAEPDYYLSFPLIPKGGLIVIGAPSKTMKSFLALNLAYDLAEGRPLFGLQKSDGSFIWPVARPLSVLYIEQEIGRQRLKERMARIHGARGGQLAVENLHFHYKDSMARLDTQTGVERIAQEAEATKADVIVLDPLRRFHLRKEDQSEEVEVLLQPIYQLQEKSGIAVILVHHTAKRSEWRSPTDPEALRGSSHLHAVGDTYMMITRPVPTKKTLLQIDFNLRSHEDPPPLRLEFDRETYVLAPVGGQQ